MIKDNDKVIMNVREKIMQDGLLSQETEIIFSALFYGALNNKDKGEEALIKEKLPISKNCEKIFKSKVKENIFVGVYSFLAQVMLQSEKEAGGALTAKLEQRARDEGSKMFTDYLFKRSLDAASMSEATEDVMVELLVQQIKEQYRALCLVSYTEEQFISALDDYIEAFRLEFLHDVSEISALIASREGITVVEGTRQRRLQGTKDALEYLSEKELYISKFGEATGVSGYVYNREYLREQKKNTLEGTPLFVTGLPEIDNVKGNVRRGQILAILGPTKGGKTSFATYLAARCLAQGLNVAIWLTDGVNSDWEAGIKVALLSNGLIHGYREEINRKLILNDELGESEEHQRFKRALAMADQMIAGEDSVLSGKLSFFTGVPYVENLQKDLNDHYKRLNAFDVFILDTPLNMQTLQRGKSKTQYLSEGIVSLANILRNELPTSVGSIWTGQIKQDVIDYLRNHPNEEMDITSASETSEMIKTPDIVLGVYGTKQELQSNKTSIMDVATRHSASFDKFYCGANLGSLRYWSQPDLNK